MDVDEDVVTVVVMEGIFDTMELMIVIIQIIKKGKLMEPPEVEYCRGETRK